MRLSFYISLPVALIIVSCKCRPVITTEVHSVELANVVEEDPPPPPPPPPPRGVFPDNNRVNAEDSLVLKIVWDEFVNALEQKNKKRIRELSLPLIDCINLSDDDADYGDWFIPVDTFIQRFVVLNGHIELLKDIKKGPFRPFKHVIEDFKPKSMPGMPEKDLTLYELSFITLEPNEAAPGHEGANMIFQFVKLKAGFRFYGMFSVP